MKTGRASCRKWMQCCTLCHAVYQLLMQADKAMQAVGLVQLS